MNRSLIVGALLVVLMLALSALLLVAGARAHEGHEWIQNGPYVTKSGIPCCDKECRKMTPAEVARLVVLPNGDYEIDGETFSLEERGVYQSIDTDYWWCRFEYLGSRVRCLFFPVAS